MVDRNHDLSITRQAELLGTSASPCSHGISRGAVYYVPKPISEVDLRLMRRIDELHLQHPFMGARMLRRALAQEGVLVGRRHIGTLRQRMGLEALAPKPGTSKARPGHTIYPYLLRNPVPTRSGHWIPPTFRWRRALSI